MNSDPAAMTMISRSARCSGPSEDAAIGGPSGRLRSRLFVWVRRGCLLRLVLRYC